MSAADRFRKANTKFSERGEYLIPIEREDKVFDAAGKETGTKLVYDRPANYTLKILKCHYLVTREKDEFFILEGEVVKSDNPRVAVGLKRTWMQGMLNDVGPTAVTDFMFAAYGFDRRDSKTLAEIKKIDAEGKLPEMLAEILDDPTDPTCKNALAGKLVDVEVKEILTKVKKEKFNLHTFFPTKAA
jgi:hypothetical protein